MGIGTVIWRVTYNLLVSLAMRKHSEMVSADVTYKEFNIHNKVLIFEYRENIFLVLCQTTIFLLFVSD